MSNLGRQFPTERRREIGIAVIEARRGGDPWHTLSRRFERSNNSLRNYIRLVSERGPYRFCAKPFLVPERIINLLRQAAGRFVATKDIIDYCYGDDEGGGPDDASGAVKQHIHKLRRKGIPIVGRAWHGYRYSIASAERTKAP